MKEFITADHLGDSGFFVIDLRWGQDDSAPYFVPVPRIPHAGDLFTGPDDTGTFRVTEVRFIYESGFYFAPSRVVVETLPADQ